MAAILINTDLATRETFKQACRKVGVSMGDAVNDYMKRFILTNLTHEEREKIFARLAIGLPWDAEVEQ